MIESRRNVSISKVFVVLVAIFFFSINSVSASTATPVFGGKYTRGIGRISWYMSYANNGGWYEYQIINAVNNWQSPGWYNPIVFVAASSNAGTMMDIYAKNETFWPTNIRVGLLAETRFYNGSGTQMNPYTNYVYTEIFINDTTMHNLNVDNMRGTIAHEIGHTLGLAHNNSNPQSIMCQTGYGRSVQTVQQIDNTAVVNLYS